MVVQSVAEYEQTQETLAMLKLLAQSEQDIAQSQTVSADDAFDLLRNRCGLGKDGED